MTASKSNLSLQDVQIAANALNTALVEAAPTARHISKSFVRTMRPWLEERDKAARTARQNKILRQRVRELERQLELKQYTDQDWFST